MKIARMTNRVLVIALVAVLIGAMLPLGALTGHSQVRAAPATIYVPDDYPTIQGAVDAASPGDTIIVRDGTYTENIDIGRDHLTVQSENGATLTTVLAADLDAPVFAVTADYVNITGFTITAASSEVGVYVYSEIGIHLHNADYCGILQNSVLNTKCGIYLSASRNNLIAANIISGTINHTGTQYGNSGITYGIRLSSSLHNTLKDNITSNGRYGGYAGWANVYGIYLHDSSHNTLTGNDASSNIASAGWIGSACHAYGIYLSSSSDNTLVDNTADGNWGADGTGTGICLHSSSNNILMRNGANSNSSPYVGYGIRLESSSGNLLTNNTASSNHGYRLYANGRGYGFSLRDSHDNTLSDNVADSNWGSSNFGCGIYLWSSSSNTLGNNSAASNTYGIHVVSSSSNGIHLNSLVDNSDNAYSSPDSTNMWNSPEDMTYTYEGHTYTSRLGNYWSDYTGSDADGDGIGDTPYLVDSDADNYPLMEPFGNYVIGTGLADSPWPKFRQNLQNTGRSPYTGPQVPQLKWTSSGGSSSPAIGTDGTIYTGSGSKLYAINPDGTVRWSFSTGGAVSSSPAIAVDGTVYVGSDDYRVYAINSAGTAKWSFATGRMVTSSPAIAADGTIYVGSRDGNLYALDPDGSLRWSTHLGETIYSSPAISTDGTVYVGTVGDFANHWKLNAVRANGTVKWSCSLNARPYASPAVGADGTIYIGTQGVYGWGTTEGLYAINPDGTQKWCFVTEYSVDSSPAIGIDGTIYVGSTDTNVYALNPDGTKKWSFAAGHWVQSSPAIGADGTIYVGSLDGRLYAITPEGIEKWSFETKYFISSPAIAADGTIYVGAYDTLYAIGEAAVPPDAPIARASDIDSQPDPMHPNTPYTVTAKYFDPDGREDLKYCYLQLKHPDKPLTMMWVQAIDEFWVYAGELGESYLSVAGTSTEIEEGGLQGYQLAWTFTIKDTWPEVESAIDFGVQAWDDSDLKSGWDYDDTKASFRLTPAAHFWISEIKPVQVTWSPDMDGDGKVDLVAGKSTMVRVSLGVKNPEALPKSATIEVQLQFDGLRYSKTTNIDELQTNNNYVDFYPNAPNSLGDQLITATVDPGDWIPEMDETNNTGEPLEVSVKDTDGLYLYYIPVDGPRTLFGLPRGYGPMDMGEFWGTVTQSGSFIGSTYPIAENKFTNAGTGSKFYGNPIPFITSILEDAIGIWLKGELDTKTKADVYVGVVPVGYFTHHLDPNCPEEYAPKGIAFPQMNIMAVITTVGYWTAPAHEVGHLLGLRLDREEYSIEKPGKEADGYWVAQRREISNGACFMGQAGAYGSFHHSESYDTRPIWICEEDYAQLFRDVRTDQLRLASQVDPDVLLVSGIISKAGTVELGRFYMVESGEAGPCVPGDYSIEILDAAGQPLMSVPFSTAFKAYLEPHDVLDIDYAGFALAIPYPEATSRIMVQHNGESLIEVNPNMKLLRDALDSVPDHGFINNPGQRRNALHRQIDVVEGMIERGQVRAAINMLERNIQDRFQKWLVDDYTVESPLQLSKVEVLSLVQSIVDRLANQLT